jgi:hypothetical protein
VAIARRSIERIEAVFLAGGRRPEDYFLVDGVPTFCGRLRAYAHPLYSLIEDDTLSRACAEYLRQRGVKEYAGPTDVSRSYTEN